MRMLYCSNCFTDIQIKAIIDGTNADARKNVNHKIGNCNFCGATDVYVCDTSNGGPIEEYFNGLLDIYTPSYMLPHNFPKNKIGFIKDILHDRWHIFNLDISENKIYDFIKSICAKKYSSNPMLFNSEVGVRQFCDTNYLEDNSILKNHNWDEFVENIKTVNRFHSSYINIEKLDDFLKYDVNPSYKEGRVFYRARICPNAGGYASDDMGAPPSCKAKDGRVNSKGIPVLYLSDSIETTLNEVRAEKYDYVTIARFRLKKDIKVIDLANIVNRISPFTDIDYTQYAINIEHLEKIAEEISKPVRSNNEFDYIPTQYISDYIKSRKYDGIEYTSVMGEGGENIAVFNPKELECIRTEVYKIDSIKYYTTPQILLAEE